MRYSYPAYFIKEESGYSVFFPDLDNIATCGCNFAQATYMAMDCPCVLVWKMVKRFRRPPLSNRSTFLIFSKTN